MGGRPLASSATVRRKQVAFSIVGTPNYMAADMLSGRGYDESVDWWSLGCILFEFFEGRPPFGGSSATEVFSQIRAVKERLEREVVGGIPEAAGTLIRSLVCEPTARLSSDGFSVVRESEWLRDVEWGRLREAEPPFIPNLSSDTDTTYFDAEDLQ